MKVYVGKFRYYYDGETEVIVATTQSRIEQELVKQAQEYAKWAVDGDDQGEMVDSPTTFDGWQQLGWDNEWYSLDWVVCDIQSDEHILKHAMEMI